MITRLHTFIRTPYYWWLAVLGALLVVGAAAGITVLVFGLWLTNLTDLVPWGLWIGIDLS